MARRPPTPTSWSSTARSATPRYTEDCGGGRARALLPDVHRRAVHGGRPDGAAGARQDRVRGDVRRLPHAGGRPDPDGRRSAARTCGCAARTPGVSIGEDGPSQMALEDLAMFRALGTARPCCTRPTARAPSRSSTAMSRPRRASPTCARRARRRPRSTRPTRRSRSAGRRRSSRRDHDDVTLVGAGITLHECLAAARHPRRRGHHGAGDRLLQREADRRATRSGARSTTPGVIVVVEDHRVEGGLGDAVLDALAATGPLARARREARRHGHPRLGDAGAAPRVGRHRRRRDRATGARPRGRLTCPNGVERPS